MLISTCICFNLAFLVQTSCLDNRVLQFFVLRFDICSHLYQVVVEKKLMRERKLTRHDIGREKFVSEVSTSFAWHMIICGPTVSLSVILPLIMDSVSTVVLKHHSYCHVLKWMCCCLFWFLNPAPDVSYLGLMFAYSISLSSYKQVLKWKDQYGGTILNQLRRLGASLDWSREVTYLFISVWEKNMSHAWTMHINT